jgi:hypothetical protein
MKKLDTFSRFEQFINECLPILAMIGGGGIALFVDSFLPAGLSPYIRYPLQGGVAVFGFVVCVFIVVGVVVSGFYSLRKHLGKKPLDEIEAEIREETWQAEEEREERRYRWFTGRSDADQRYSLWLAQKRVVEQLQATNTNLRAIIMLVGGALFFFLALRLF